MFANNTQILVVDDMSAMRIRITNQLKSFGFENIFQAEDGAAAWKMLDESYKEMRPYGLVVSDWNMPNMSGLELLTKVRTTYHLKSLPFLMVTAEGEKEQVIKAIKAGVSDFVIKPVDKDGLMAKLQNVWKKHN